MAGILAGLLGSFPTASGAYELIESQILTGTASNIAFVSIPQTYKHLQLRIVSKTNSAGNSDRVALRFNNDSGTSSYSAHWIIGEGGSMVSQYSGATENKADFGVTATSNTASSFGVSVVDILDYTSTSKFKTFRSLSGLTSSTSSSSTIRLVSGLYRNTSAVSRLDIVNYSVNYIAGCRFSLYGIKG